MSEQTVLDARPIQDIPKEDIQKYMLAHRCSPVEAFSDLLSERLQEKIKLGEYGVVLKVLVDTVIGGGRKK